MSKTNFTAEAQLFTDEMLKIIERKSETNDKTEKKIKNSSEQGKVLIKSITAFIKKNIHNERFYDELLDKFEKPFQETIDLLKEEQIKEKDTIKALSLLQDLWRLDRVINKYSNDDPLGETFFTLVCSFEGIDIICSFNKTELKEFEKHNGTMFYKLFDNEPDDIAFSEYRVAVMAGRVDESFRIIKERKKKQKNKK